MTEPRGVVPGRLRSSNWKWSGEPIVPGRSTGKQVNDTVFTRIDVRDGHVTGW